MGKGRRRPSSRWWRWSSKGRGGEKFYVKVLWEKLRSNRGIQEEDLGVLVLGREQKSKKMKTNHLQRTQLLKNEKADKMFNLTVAQPRSRSLCGPTSKQ